MFALADGIPCLGRWDKKRYAGLSFGSVEDKGKLDFKAGSISPTDEKMEGWLSSFTRDNPRDRGLSHQGYEPAPNLKQLEKKKTSAWIYRGL